MGQWLDLILEVISNTNDSIIPKSRPEMCWWLDLMFLEVFSNCNDSIIHGMAMG